MRVDMSPQGIDVRLKRVSQLRDLCLSLSRSKPINSPNESCHMSVEENKALVRRWVDAWNTDTIFETIDQIFTTDCIDRNSMLGGVRGIEGARRLVRVFRSAFSNIQVKIDLLISEGEWVAFRWIASAIHTGEFRNIAPTGKKVTITGITIHRVVDGKFAEGVTEIDCLGLLEQLGASPVS